MVLILGSSGFIGRALLDYLVKKKVKVTGLSSIDLDLTKSKYSNKLTKYFTPQTTLIFASAITRQKGDTFESMKINIQMAKTVASAMESKIIKKIVYLSTVDVYGFPRSKVNELTPPDPKTYYAISKLTSEFILKKTAYSINIPLLILRLGGIYGPGQINIQYGPNAFINSILEDKKVYLWGNGEEKRDLVFISDLIKIINLLSLKKTSGICNIATGTTTSFLKIVKLLQKGSEQIKIIKRVRTSPKFNLEFDAKKLKKILPNFHFTNLEKALKTTFDSFDK